MYSSEPFPEVGSCEESSSSTNEQLLRKDQSQRFGKTGAYRDVPFAVLFVLQLVLMVVIAVTNGMALGRVNPTPSIIAVPPSPPNLSLRDLERSHDMLVMLAVSGICGGVLAASWLAMLRAGARLFMFAGAGGGCLFGLANAGFLLAQGNAAGIVLGLASLVAAVACVLFIAFNRQRIDFSVALLSTVAQLIQEYPAMLLLALAAWLLQLLWLLLWSAAFSFTALQSQQAAVLFLLLLSFLWTAQLIKAVLHCSIAGTVAAWYFLSPNVPREPTARALRRALTTSFGSLCLGALVASSLKALRAGTRLAFASHAGRGGAAELVRSCVLCLLGFLDVLVRFFNEYAYTQVAMYGKGFTTASRDVWTLLMHSSTGVDYLIHRELVSAALTCGAVFSGLLSALVTGVWASAALGEEQPQWWQATLAAFLIGYGSVSLVSSVVESAVCALFVCFAEDPTPLAAIDAQLLALFSSTPPPGGASHVPPPAPLGEYDPTRAATCASCASARPSHSSTAGGPFTAEAAAVAAVAPAEKQPVDYVLQEPAAPSADGYQAFPTPAASVPLASAYPALRSAGARQEEATGADSRNS